MCEILAAARPPEATQSDRGDAGEALEGGEGGGESRTRLWGGTSTMAAQMPCLPFFAMCVVCFAAVMLDSCQQLPSPLCPPKKRPWVCLFLPAYLAIIACVACLRRSISFPAIVVLCAGAVRCREYRLLLLRRGSGRVARGGMKKSVDDGCCWYVLIHPGTGGFVSTLRRRRWR